MYTLRSKIFTAHNVVEKPVQSHDHARYTIISDVTARCMLGLFLDLEHLNLPELMRPVLGLKLGVGNSPGLYCL